MRDQLSQKSWENMADMIPDNIRHICLLLLKRYLVLFHFLEKYEVHLSNFQNMRYTFQFSKVLQNYPKFTAAMMKMVCRHENKFKHPSFCDQNLEHCVHMFHMLQKWYLSRSVFVFSSQWPNSSGPCALRLEILASGRLFGVNVTLELY